MEDIGINYQVVLALVALVVFLIVVMAIISGMRWALSLRQVVPPDYIHAVTYSSGRVYYGAPGTKMSYIRWPSWVPYWGVDVKVLPTWIIERKLTAHRAWDKNNLPFVLDITAFFKMDLEHVDLAFRSVENLNTFKQHLTEVFEGVVRNLLAKYDILQILKERSVLAETFKLAIGKSVEEFGFVAVKDVEIKHIDDADDSTAISDIRAKQQAIYDREARQVKARESRAAEEAEIENALAVSIKREQQREDEGKRSAEASRIIALEEETTKRLLEQERYKTTQEEVAVKRYKDTEAANIAREVAKVQAEEKRVLVEVAATARLSEEQKVAEGIQAKGDAEAGAERAMQLATVQAQIELAHKIGDNQGYQNYLLGKHQIDANKDVGLAYAKALAQAGVKVFATNGQGGVSEAVKKVSDLFNPSVGLQVGSFLEGVRATDAGAKAVDSVADALAKKDK